MRVNPFLDSSLSGEAPKHRPHPRIAEITAAWCGDRAEQRPGVRNPQLASPITPTREDLCSLSIQSNSPVAVTLPVQHADGAARQVHILWAESQGLAHAETRAPKGDDEGTRSQPGGAAVARIQEASNFVGRKGLRGQLPPLVRGPFFAFRIWLQRCRLVS